MDYNSYTEEELKIILYEPREIAKEPYKLLTSFIFNSVIEAFFGEHVDEEGFTPWGLQLPSKTLFRFINDCIVDFKSAAENDDTIKINGQGFTIRKHSEIDYNKVLDIFSWNKDGLTTITKEGIKNIECSSPQTYEEKKVMYADNRLYYWKVMVQGFTDEGYDKLTDMEVAMYCWAMWIRDIPMSATVNDDMVKEWWKQEYSYFELPLKEVISCFCDETIKNNMNTPCIFSAEKIRKWNQSHKVKSVIDNINKEEAEYKWYTDVAITLMRK